MRALGTTTCGVKNRPEARLAALSTDRRSDQQCCHPTRCWEIAGHEIGEVEDGRETWFVGLPFFRSEAGSDLPILIKARSFGPRAGMTIRVGGHADDAALAQTFKALVQIRPLQLKSLVFQSCPQTLHHPNLYAAAEIRER